MREEALARREALTLDHRSCQEHDFNEPPDRHEGLGTQQV